MCNKDKLKNIGIKKNSIQKQNYRLIESLQETYLSYLGCLKLLSELTGFDYSDNNVIDKAKELLNNIK